jgi:hypothetical protein
MRTLSLLSWIMLLAGCAAAPPTPFAGPDPADASVHVPPPSYRSTIGPYERRRPVEPKPWLEQNERVVPEQR